MRDINYEHYSWTLYSPVSVKMPVEMKTRFPLEDEIKYIESTMHKKKMKISQAQYAFFSDWRKNNYIFRVNVLRSGTRREELLLKPDVLQKGLDLEKTFERRTKSSDGILARTLKATKSNADFFDLMRRGG